MKPELIIDNILPVILADPGNLLFGIGIFLFFFILFIFFSRSEKRKIVLTEQQFRKLNNKLEITREEERKRLSRELHDILGQQLTSLKMDLSMAKRQTQEPAVTEKITSAMNQVDEMIQTIRKISSELRPGILDDLGLIPALEWQCTEFEKRHNIPCAFKTNVDDSKLRTEKSIAVFRILQEALTNILRHAKASKVIVDFFETANQIKLTITDNGRGINTSEIKNNTSLGLLGMRERAAGVEGKLTHKGESGVGTTVELELPL